MQDENCLIAIVASAAHEDWRIQYRAVNGDKPRIKKTKDADWSAAHDGATELDIASTVYEDLPADWQAENLAGAESAVRTLMAADMLGRNLDEAFVEEASAIQHDDWLERNGSWAPPEQAVPYAELSEADKAKDRFFVLETIKAFERLEHSQRMHEAYGGLAPRAVDFKPLP